MTVDRLDEWMARNTSARERATWKVNEGVALADLTPAEREAYIQRCTGSIVTNVAQVERERVRWLWKDRIPAGKLSVFDGDPGVGKSTLTLDLAARITVGAVWPDGVPGSGEGGDVVILSAEDGIGDTIRPRLEAAGADLDRVHVFEAMRELFGDDLVDRPPSFPADVVDLERAVAERNAAVLFIDPFMAYLGAKVDSYRDQDVRRVLHLFSTLAERTGAAIVVVRHLSKTGGAHALYRGGGSIGIIGAARAAMLAAPDPEDDSRRVLAMTKSNLAAMPPSLAYRLVNVEEFGCGRIEWLGETAHKAGDLLSGPDTDEDRGARDEAVEFLRDLLASGPVPAADAMKAARAERIADRTLARARKRIATSTRVGFGPGSHVVWELTP